ncbi:glycoside hydrolase family 3 N-terminal domain-containing protein [Psychrosphaera algicola]|uniref:Glycoside hydrolase family 3 N-terminal domain-containing protein n=1 Tax=Psychrosphaera algicola TaxID=3023714 RepID=A0ABT5FGW6_9GAMM|nr:glycoside hydrolase family 3 N-terminal domain-containing protein [Psychrosphaera sp. G1-22]MDC2890242.1 glycoside hydrolase family 3 N-terminal domain-containing protein [Psychrosphaera sp. G1-22]
MLCLINQHAEQRLPKNENKKTLILASLTSTILLSCSATDWLAKSEVQASTGKPTFAFQDENLSVEQRVNDLVSQMTLEEKVGQLFDKAPAIERLQVPAYKWWNEALHGVARAGTATVFPQAIGLAATFDEDLMLKVGTAISDEGRAKHHAFLAENNRSMYTGLTYWSPNINIFRDPRWGRSRKLTVKTHTLPRASQSIL